VPSVLLIVGERQELRFRGLGSAGYSWDVTVDGPEGVVGVTRRPSGPLPAAEPGGPPPDNVSLPELFELEGLAPGHVRITFTLGRRWETDVPPLEREELEVTVA